MSYVVLKLVNGAWPVLRNGRVRDAPAAEAELRQQVFLDRASCTASAGSTCRRRSGVNCVVADRVAERVVPAAHRDLQRRRVAEDAGRRCQPVAPRDVRDHVERVHVAADRPAADAVGQLGLVRVEHVPAGEPPVVPHLVVHPDHRLVQRRARRRLALVVVAHLPGRVGLGEDAQRGERRRVEAVRRDLAQHAAVLEAPGRVRRAAGEPRRVVADVGVQVAVRVDGSARSRPSARGRSAP